MATLTRYTDCAALWRLCSMTSQHPSELALECNLKEQIWTVSTAVNLTYKDDYCEWQRRCPHTAGFQASEAKPFAALFPLKCAPWNHGTLWKSNKGSDHLQLHVKPKAQSRSHLRQSPQFRTLTYKLNKMLSGVLDCMSLILLKTSKRTNKKKQTNDGTKERDQPAQYLSHNHKEWCLELLGTRATR